MHSVFICTTLVISVSSVFSQQPFVRYSESLKKVVPHHYSHDKENPHRSMDKVARGHKVEPRQPRLRPQPEVPWLQWVHKGRWAAQADRNSELHKVRARLLEEKLKPNQLVFKPHINPQLKPKLRPIENTRTKREAEYDEMEHKVKARDKRDVVMHQSYPEINRPPLMDTKTSQHTEQFGGRVKESEKRDKRQILYFINRPFQLMARSPRTTPNPFIRDTHIEEYDIIRPEVGEREGMIPTIETGSSDPGSYPLVSETSDLEYESDYTISMSDSEEWHNYPLTTPSGPNPGWQLSTLADIYQKQRKPQNQVLKPERKSDMKTILHVWPLNENKPHIRAKRSPKERKRKIGAYKEKIKQRRKLKDLRRKRRIIRNSKEDKAVKEVVKDEKEIERLLQKPRAFPRQTAYQMEDTSKEILWTNGTHNIVEDKEATVKWINETHYVIYREQDNSTDEWYHKHHVLLYNDEWENKTSEERRNMTIGLQEEEVEEVKEKDEKTKVKTAVKKKPEKRKGRKGVDKKAPKPKKKSKKSKKIMTVKNIHEAPKDPRRDPREKKIVKDTSSSEEIVKKKKKRTKLEDESDQSKSKERKKKKVKTGKTTDVEDDSGKKKKRKKAKSESDEKDASEKKLKKKKKEKTKDSTEKKADKKIRKKEKTKDSAEKKSDKKTKLVKEKKIDKEKKKKPEKTNDLNEDEGVKKKKKDKKDKDITGAKEDKDETRRKRSIYRSSESETVEIKWEKVHKKNDYDGWQVFGEDDKSEVYDVSYELIETKNITKTH
ncbi:DNA ligase 1-like isoform X2 [Macrosteles quadrilineatus]|uniref:DNA ligase 1-like isoform X2 n=1 Tax=Macrosteles quadrilineatus TaxID=74068 RepID=UPI0023E0C149|nr:DNA ligase 1-like isoform X2 [Macrosteles quadrilineatus]